MHTPQPVDIQSILSQFIDNTDEDIFFVQIGANDGERKDFITEYINKFNWKGIMVEPVHHLFEKLQSKYDGKGIILENVAITNQIGEQDIFRLPIDIIGHPEWIDGLASLNKNVILSHSFEIPNISDLIITEKVATTTLSALFNKHHIENVHLLHIDTEGHDFEIIKMIDFSNIFPEVIIFEYAHITVYNYYQAIAYLESKGYHVLHSHNSYDIMAIDLRLL